MFYQYIHAKEQKLPNVQQHLRRKLHQKIQSAPDEVGMWRYQFYITKVQ